MPAIKYTFEPSLTFAAATAAGITCILWLLMHRLLGPEAQSLLPDSILHTHTRVCLLPFAYCCRSSPSSLLRPPAREAVQCESSREIATPSTLCLPFSLSLPFSSLAQSLCSSPLLLIFPFACCSFPGFGVRREQKNMRGTREHNGQQPALLPHNPPNHQGGSLHTVCLCLTSEGDEARHV